jgi:hypothetical protein
MSYTERTESRGMLVTGHSQIKPNNLTTLEVHWLVWNIGKTSNSNRWSSVSFSFTIQILRWYTQFSDTHTHVGSCCYATPSMAAPAPIPPAQRCLDHTLRVLKNPGVQWSSNGVMTQTNVQKYIEISYRPKSSQIQKFWDLSWASLENNN